MLESLYMIYTTLKVFERNSNSFVVTIGVPYVYKLTLPPAPFPFSRRVLSALFVYKTVLFFHS